MNESVTLRPVEPDDVGIFFGHMQDREAQHMAAFTAPGPANRTAHDAHWARIMADEQVFARSVLVKGQVAGHIAKFVMFGDAEITYWLDRAYWGRGVATRALGLFLLAYTDRPLHARAAKDNLASIWVLEKCGFMLSGDDRGFAHARDAEIDEVVLVLNA